MKHLTMLAALVAAMTATFLMSSAKAADYAKAADDHVAAAEAKDPNFRWHNGRWWYWMADQQHWKVWDGNAWQTHQPQARRFSYQQDAVVMPSQTMRPRAQSGRITQSFGVRDAGSKVRGNY